MNKQEKKDWMVYVSCTTFNHAPYIEDAMNGFTMQETNFPFVCGIIDDASIDGEQEVIKNYLNDHFDLEDREVAQHEETDDYVLTFARHKTNLNCHFVVFNLKYNHYSIKKPRIPYVAPWRYSAKYIALCEGDDYWINPFKLQKQFDFMESNSKCMLCATNALTIWDEGYKNPCYFKKYYHTGMVPIRDIIGSWLFATATLFFRKELTDNYPEWTQKVYFGDMTRILIAAHKGEVGVLESLTTIYRKSQNNNDSITNRLSKKMDYVKSQQIVLYEEFQKWTEGKYSDLVNQTIINLKKEKRYYRYKKINKFLPYLLMPLYIVRERFLKK